MDRAALYAKTMDRIMAQPEENKNWAVRILTWVCCAPRALTLDELQVAIQPKPFSGSTLDDSFKLSNEDIMEFCGGLISINIHTDSVVLFHYTVKEYFRHNMEKHFPEARDMIVSRCTARLGSTLQDLVHRLQIANDNGLIAPQGYGVSGLLEDHEVQNIQTLLRFEAQVCYYPPRCILASYQLAWYSLENLGYHVRDAENNLTSAPESVNGLNCAGSRPFSPRRGVSLSRQTYRQLHNLISEPKTRALLVGLLYFERCRYRKRDLDMPHEFNESTPIHVATIFGFFETTATLLDEIPDEINARDNNNETAVMIAAGNDDCNLVTLFLQRGAELNLQCVSERRVLFYAVDKGLAEDVKSIITRAQDPASNPKFSSRLGSNNHPAWPGASLICSAYNGDCATITRLLEDSSIVQCAMKDGLLDVCLHLAPQFRRLDMLQTFLVGGVDINSRDPAGYTALHRAASRNDRDLIKMLIEHEADTRIEWPRIYGPADHAELQLDVLKEESLKMAAFCGQEHTIHLWLAGGADLLLAKWHGCCPLVSMLLSLSLKTFLTYNSTGLF